MNSDFTELCKVYRFTREAHAGMTRKNGDSFISHPKEVYRTVRDYGGDKISRFAALLHDVVEDTRFSLSDIETKFGKEVSFIVDGLTGKGLEEVVERLKEYSKRDKRVILVRLGDIRHNLLTPINTLKERYKKYVEVAIIMGREFGYERIADDVERVYLELIQKNGTR